MKEVGVPIACTMRIGPSGDKNNVSPGDCAVRMAQAGIIIIAIIILRTPEIAKGCQWGPLSTLYIDPH